MADPEQQCERCEREFDGDLEPVMRDGWAFCEECADKEAEREMWAELEARELSGFYGDEDS